MKIALCISGQPRGIPLTCEFLKNSVIVPNGITDIFVHTWYHPSIDNVSFDSAQPARSNTVGKWIPNMDKIIQTTLKPTIMLTEAPKSFEEFAHLQNRDSAIQTSLASMYYSAYKANELKSNYEASNNFKYDVVIKTRIDLNYYSPVTVKDLIDEDLDKAVYVAEMHQYMRQSDAYPTKSGWAYSSMSDTFVMGNSANMDVVASIYKNFANHHEEIWPYVYGEAYMGYVVRGLHKIPVKMKNISYIIHRQ